MMDTKDSHRKGTRFCLMRTAGRELTTVRQNTEHRCSSMISGVWGTDEHMTSTYSDFYSYSNIDISDKTE